MMAQTSASEQNRRRCVDRSSKNGSLHIAEYPGSSHSKYTPTALRTSSISMPRNPHCVEATCCEAGESLTLRLSSPGAGPVAQLGWVADGSGDVPTLEPDHD
jgi:hypothetical protein